MTDKPDKTVKVAELKAHLSAYLRLARRGHGITVLDRETPIARLVPYPPGSPLVVREALKAPGDITLPPPLPRAVDSLSALLAEREPSR